MNKMIKSAIVGFVSIGAILTGFAGAALAAQALDFYSTPSFLTQEEPPLVMLVMGKNHKLYYEAYNDASDLNGDGLLDISYNPDIEYYGYFDSYKCYSHDGTKFVPESAPKDINGKPIKICTDSNDSYWSGDFLNYLTMSRMDALRKVLYGGFRRVDLEGSTVLERTYIPQDAHSWGKHYESIAKNGYDIREYTPYDLPVPQPNGDPSRHLFANTSLSEPDETATPPVLPDPNLRVVLNDRHYIWEWASVESLVLKDSIITNAVSNHPGHPANAAEYDDLLTQVAIPANYLGSQTVSQIDGSGNPFGLNDNYLTIFSGALEVGVSGDYEFSVDGDDAVMVIIDGTVVAGYYGGHGPCNCNSHSGTISLTAGVEYDLEFRHEEMGGGDSYTLRWRKTSGSGTFPWEVTPASAFPYGLSQSVFGMSIPGNSITDFAVRVEVCKPGMLENNCKRYEDDTLTDAGGNPIPDPTPSYKPVGLLQRYGEEKKMYFGLMSGSYEKNLSGGVLRKNVSDFNDEIDPASGQFIYPASGGIVETINKFRILDYNFNGNSSSYNPGWSGAWVVDRTMRDGEFMDWGNPIAEMMYETLRYFSGKADETDVFDYAYATAVDTTDLDLPKPAWIDPYGENPSTPGSPYFERCSKPFMLVLSDIYPTFDSDQLPGVEQNFLDNIPFTTQSPELDNTDDFFTGAGDTPIMDVSALANAITLGESIDDNFFIGQSDSLNYNGACTPKTVNDLGEIRGLCPEEPTKQGSYYAAAVAYYGAMNDVHPVGGAQRVSTFTVGLASPLPKINIEVPDSAGGDPHLVTLVPFAKSVSDTCGSLNVPTAEGDFQPTNTIVDFYVEEIGPTSGKFRVNFEDVEQAADHDMDAIVYYEYDVIMDDPTDGIDPNQVQVRLDASEYASGCIIQHLGYIISGTTADGTYLEVRDEDTEPGDDADYFLDTPNVAGPLPFTSSRTFTPGTYNGATDLENPLYYAAKWGGFRDSDTEDEDINNNGELDAGEDLNGNGRLDYITAPEPNLPVEWDRDGDDQPDNYFYVVNPLKLEEQLNKVFNEMLRRASSGTAASVISSSRSGEGAVYQSIFYPEFEDQNAVGGSVQPAQWVGEVRAVMVDAYGNMRIDRSVNDAGNSWRVNWPAGEQQLNFYNEDVNGNGVLDNEDANGNGLLDDGEDLNGNNRLDNEDLDGDNEIDYRDLILVLRDGRAQLWNDMNENGRKDDEDQVIFDPDYPLWHGNGVLDTEDTDGDGILDTEDTNGNGTLDEGEDTNNNGILDLGEDLNGNGILDFEDLNGNGGLPETELVAETSNPNMFLDDYLWNTRNWLDDFILNPASQRFYNSDIVERYIFTFADSNGDMIANGGEIQPFQIDSAPTEADLKNQSNFYSYLTLHPTFDDKPQWVKNIESDGNKWDFLGQQAQRVVNWVRGEDQGEVIIGTRTIPRMRSRQYRTFGDLSDRTWRLGDIVSSSPTLVGRPAENYHLIYRDRSYAFFLARYLNRRNVVYVGGNDGMIHAFNGGFYDYQTNSFVEQMAEPYIDLNNDGDYDGPTGPDDPGEPWADWNANGMWDDATQNALDLGAEIWAYVPFNQLPHLYWLTEQDYPHVYYNDLTPKIFDAKIFPFDSANPTAGTHPHGWGTVMVIGMKYGGGHIIADTNKDDLIDANNDNVIDSTDREMKSAYVIFDITDPEQEPRVLAEITLPGTGFTTCYPTVVPMRSKSGSGSSTQFDTNEWHLVFGSGPADSNGYPSSRSIGDLEDSGTLGDEDILSVGISKQNGKLFALNLLALTDVDPVTGLELNNPRVEVIDELGNRTIITSASNSAHIEEFSDRSYVSRPVTIDYNLNFNADVVYFGTVEWDNINSAWGGKLKRLITNDSVFDTVNSRYDWVDVDALAGVDRADNVLLDLTFGSDGLGNLTGVSEPITAAPSAAVGKRLTFDIDASGEIDVFDRERWVFFGTGRFESSDDAQDSSQRGYYGVKETYTLADPLAPAIPFGFTWEEVDRANMVNSTFIDVWDDRRVENHPLDSDIDTWNELIDSMEGASSYPGWYIEFQETNERNLGQAALLGGLLIFTTYEPSLDPCMTEGTSNLYARWYQTGTSFYRRIFRTGNDWFDDDSDNIQDRGETRISGKTELGQGMALTPNIHTGREEGSTAYVQTSTGDIITIEQEEAEATKSHKSSWTQRR